MLRISEHKQNAIREIEDSTDDPDDSESINIETICFYIIGKQNEDQQH